ncbi:Pituitary homeobox 3 [Echinococcus granulosus]|nr:Pituitary homeobox 3 [Echinococcus granulosus]
MVDPINRRSSLQSFGSRQSPGPRLIVEAKAGNSKTPSSDQASETDGSSRTQESQGTASTTTKHTSIICDKPKSQLPSTSAIKHICDSENLVQEDHKPDEEKASEQFYANYLFKLLEVMRRSYESQPSFPISNTQPSVMSGDLAFQPPGRSLSPNYTSKKESGPPISEEYLQAYNYFMFILWQGMHRNPDSENTSPQSHHSSGTSVDQLHSDANLTRSEDRSKLRQQTRGQCGTRPTQPRMSKQPSATYQSLEFGCDNSATQYSPADEASKHHEESDSRRESGRRSRTVFTMRQLSFLERVFQENRFPNIDTRCRLAQLLDLDESRVNIWFQNRRARWRRRELQSTLQSNSSQPPSVDDAAATTPGSEL